MKLVFLGTASCYPTANRGVSCTALKHNNGDIWLFDCGEGSQIQLQKSNLHPGKIRKIFITHLHGDHLFGLPGLICSLGCNLDSPKNDLTIEIYGPLGLRRYIRESLNLSRTVLPFKFIVNQLIPNDKNEDWIIDENDTLTLHPQEIKGVDITSNNNVWKLFKGDITVEAGPLVHTIPSFGFVLKEKSKTGKLNVEKLFSKGLTHGPIFGKLKAGNQVILGTGEVLKPTDFLGPDIPGKIITILGDTCDSSKLTEIANCSDILIHETTLEDGMEAKALSKGHSTPTMAANFAASINAKTLILFHFSQRYRNGEDTVSTQILLKETEAAVKANGHTCKVVLSDDLMEYEV